MTTKMCEEKDNVSVTSVEKNPHSVAESLLEIYDEMRTRQRKAIIQQQCMRADPFFACNPARLDDDRRCLAISCVMNEENLISGDSCLWTDAYLELQNRLKLLCTGANKYDDISKENDFEKGDNLQFGQSVDFEGGICGQLHFTLMQLVGFSDYDAEMQDNCIYASSQYMDCVQDALIIGGMDVEVKIHFIGCIAVATGLLMVGIPDALDINVARNRVRQNLKKRGFPLKEPFLNDIIHSTLFRVTDDQTRTDPSLYKKILDLSKEFEQVHLGTVTLRNFQIGPASWRMLPMELAATPPWRKWTLPNRSTQEEYYNSVIDTPDHRNCVTLSGASGANLAREVRRVLSAPPMKDSGEENEKEIAPIISSFMKNKNARNSKNITEERAKKSVSMTLTHGVGSLSNLIDSINLQHDKEDDRIESIRRELKVQNQSSVNVNHAAKNAATVSGVSGLLLAQELQKRLEMEKQRLVNDYETEFF